MDSKKSLVQYFPNDKADSCGYCKCQNGSRKLGMWAHQLTVHDYQHLINRGWRRCGYYCYKPILPDSCCTLYTIRCDATKSKLSRSQKRVLKRMNAYLIAGAKPKQYQNFSGSDNNVSEKLAEGMFNQPIALLDMQVESKLPISSSSKSEKKLQLTSPAALEPNSGSISNDHRNEPDFAEKQVKTVPTKAKQLRILRKREKLVAKGLSEAEIARKMVEKKRYTTIKTVEDFIDLPVKLTHAHRLEVRLVRSSPASKEFEDTFEDSFNLYKKYQMVVHKDSSDSITRTSYSRFLVRSPLIEEEEYGSFHQQYWLDGQLIAVGVVDILPSCVSSVYLYYDPEFAFLSLGTYGALRELQLVRSLQKSNPHLTFLYMGFYIQTCPKMKYKGAFQPSFLLCPEAYTWHPIEECLPKIEKQKYVRLNADDSVCDSNAQFDSSQVMVVWRKKLERMSDLAMKVVARNELTEYASAVGTACATSMILHIN